MKIKLSQYSFFGRTEDTIICFRDFLTFSKEVCNRAVIYQPVLARNSGENSSLLGIRAQAPIFLKNDIIGDVSQNLPYPTFFLQKMDPKNFMVSN